MFLNVLATKKSSSLERGSITKAIAISSSELHVLFGYKELLKGYIFEYLHFHQEQK